MRLLLLISALTAASAFLPPPLSTRTPSISLSAKKPRRSDDFEDDFEDDFYSPRPRKMKKSTPFLSLPESLTKALLAGVFVLGIGTGVTVDSAINTNEKDLASRDAIDKNAPNPRLCTSYGASAMAFDQRVFVSFNPFNVYVSQADVKPACVLRQSNAVNVLQVRGGDEREGNVQTLIVLSVTFFSHNMHNMHNMHRTVNL